MNPINYLKKKGIKRALEVLYQYKIDILLQKIMRPFLIYKPLQNIIMIESHNDFDSNGGALYNYLIDHRYNRKYKIVWLIKHPESVPRKLPENVIWFREFSPSIKKNYYRYVTKWFTYDQDCSPKLREGQISIFMTHGAVGLKDCTGLVHLPKDLDYILTASEWWLPYDARQFLMRSDDSRFQIQGYPIHDVLYSGNKGELNKVTREHFEKVILWMPTFRRNVGQRVDGEEKALGIPLFDNVDQLKNFNNYLRNLNALLLIKIHPKQDLDSVKLKNMSNIYVLDGKKVKQLNIDNYRLMNDVDALISDYSTVAYDFLHCGKPIAYDISDLDNYTRGIVVKDPHVMMAGYELYSIEDLRVFVKDVSNNSDPYRKEREELFERVFKFHDGNSCQRIVELLKL